MNSLRCSNCSFLNFATATACKRCGLPIESAPGQEWVAPPPYAPIGANPPPTEGGSYFWDQPAAYMPTYMPPQPARMASGAPLLVKIGVGLVLICLAAFLAIPTLLKNRKVDYTKLSWSEYRSPDGKFSTSFPAAPKISEQPIPLPTGTTQAHMLTAELSRDSGCMLMYVDYPIEHINIPEETLYDAALQGATRRQNSVTVGARRYVTLNGRRGVEAELNPADPKMGATGLVRIFWVSPRLYVMVAGGPNTPEFKAVQTKCFDSFKFGGGV